MNVIENSITAEFANKSGWVYGCEYGDEAERHCHHFVVFCSGGPDDGKLVTFHGENPHSFVSPGAGRYDVIGCDHSDPRFPRCPDNAVAVWRGKRAFYDSDIQRHWWRRWRRRVGKAVYEWSMS